MKLHLIVATRPNFVKAAPLCRAIAACKGISISLIHTGQHYDQLMSDQFFNDFELQRPARHLGISGGNHVEQIAGVMSAYGAMLDTEKPEWTLVLGDVNATLAATLAAKHAGVRVGHVEAGLRSFDLTMPEEINRKLVDAVADRLWAPSQDAVDNLMKEGREASDIALVGNVMIDALEILRPRIAVSNILSRLDLKAQGYVLASLHRPHNVDAYVDLVASLRALDAAAETAPVIFPVHPRTRARLTAHRLAPTHPDVRLLEPLDYVSFLRLQRDAIVVVTDSGGVQEETSQEGVPCLTLRPNTERPITITLGTNRLIKPEEVGAIVAAAANAHRQPAEIPLWDGIAAQRIIEDLIAQPRP